MRSIFNLLLIFTMTAPLSLSLGCNERDGEVYEEEIGEEEIGEEEIGE